MGTHNIDSEIRRIFNESADFYNLEADNSEERIWQQVRLKKQNQPKFYLIRTLAAACILLFITTSIIAISNIKADKKIQTLVELNSSMQSQINASRKNTSTQKEAFVASRAIVPDTVYVEKIVSVYKPIIKTEQITDTVYVERTVYLEKEMPQKLTAVIDNYGSVATTSKPTIPNSNETQIVIRNNQNVNQIKQRKLQFKFGGNKNQSNEGTLALTTRL